jgi:hypothetical protein
MIGTPRFIVFLAVFLIVLTLIGGLRMFPARSGLKNIPDNRWTGRRYIYMDQRKRRGGCWPFPIGIRHTAAYRSGGDE